MKFDENKGVRGKKEEPVDCFDDDELEEEGERRKEAAACCLLKGEEERERERAGTGISQVRPKLLRKQEKKSESSSLYIYFSCMQQRETFCSISPFFLFRVRCAFRGGGQSNMYMKYPGSRRSHFTDRIQAAAGVVEADGGALGS